MVAEFVESSTETRSGFRAFETAHESISPLDPSMILLDPIIQVLVAAMFHAFVQFSSDRARITIVTVRRDTRGGDAGHGFGGAKKRLRRLHVAGLAQPDVDKRTETINRAIEVAPSAVHFGVSLVNVPAFSDPALAPTPKVVDQGWGELRLPVTDGFVTEFDASDQEHLRQITQAQFVSEAPEDHQRDDVGRVLSAVENSTAALIELLSTNTAPKAPVTVRRSLRPFRNLRRVALNAPHFPFLPPGGSYARRALSGQSILARRMTKRFFRVIVITPLKRRGII
jgi:hypothetical protein